MRFGRSAVAIAVVALAASACSSGSGSSPSTTSDAATTAAAASAAAASPAANTQTVQLGALFPLSGADASAGLDALHGVELAVQVINGKYADISLPLAATAGLPHLNGATLKVVSEDTQSDPQTGASDVDRLVNDEHVAAITGAYESAVTQTASQSAERLGVPFVNGASSAVSLTQGGLKWFFRTGPTDQTFGQSMFDFLDAEKKAGKQINSIAVIHSNDTYGNGGATITKQLAGTSGYSVAADVSFDTSATDLSSQVLQLRAAKPDAVFVLAYTNQALLLLKAFDQLNYHPPAVLAYGAGFVDPAFIKGAGASANGVMTRASWSQEIAEKNAAAKAIATLFQQTYNAPMTENSARTFTATIVLAQAIDQAGSTDPDKIRQALQAMNLTPDQIIMPWQGVKFDSTGQNSEAAGVVEQLDSGAYHVVFPANAASTQAQWPWKATS
jgi:branched-chain amino acid transport system substrate-binding protein